MSIISGNWKMNGSKKDLDQWFEDFFKQAKEFEKNNTIKDNPLLLICVPDLYFSYAQELAKKYNATTKTLKVNIGLQDLHQEDKGAFTGNTSAVFAEEFGCNYSILGHSERRQYQHESNEIVAKKAINAIKHNITPLLCIGETLEIREAKKHLEFIEKQLLESIKDVDLSKTIIAYEPVWAIGTGKVPTMAEIDEICTFIKKIASKSTGLNIKDIKVLYGGSVKSSNVAEISKIEAVDGVLVGGASLKGEEFFNIYKNSL